MSGRLALLEGRLVDLGAVPLEPALRPFSAGSVWRLGVAQGAVFAADSDPRNVAIRNTGADGSGKVWVNSDDHSHPISYASPDSPLATVVDTVNGGSWTEQIPADARIATGSDKHMHVVTPDGTHLLEHFAVTRVSPARYDCGRRIEVDLLGSGIGPQNGVRAYGGSAIGGLIRGWEVDPAHPRYTGRIKHALAIALRGDQLYMDAAHYGGSQGYYTSGTLDPTKHPGWPAGTSAAGFMKQTGYVWPATEQDWASPTSYSGTIPMGSFFAIPSGTALDSLGLQTTQGRMLARAARDYGCYVTDYSGASAFYCENDGGPAQVFASALLGGASASAHDARAVFNALRVIPGNAAATPNGGPTGTLRRG